MLYFTRWKALGIILTALVVCLCAVPNFFPEAQVKTWPAWAQRRLVLGLDLQGGSYLLLEVDSNYVKKEKLDQIRDDVRRTLRDARIGYTGLATRPDSVEVRVKESDLSNALAKLRGDGIEFTVHAPFRDLNIASLNPGAYEAARADMMRAMRIAHRVGASVLNVHPGIHGWWRP